MYLQHGYHHILIVSAEGLSKITDYTDRSTCVLFGDAAGACVVGKGDGDFQSVLGHRRYRRPHPLCETAAQ